MTASATAIPALSPSFDRARRISGFLSVILSIGFWLTVVGMIIIFCVFVALLVISPEVSGLAQGTIDLNGGTIHLDKLTQGERAYGAAALAVATLPSLFILHHARLVFRHFKAGEVFAAAPIEHIRKTGLWLMISLATNFIAQLLIDLAVRSQKTAVDLDADPLWLVFGLAVYVAAYVMSEARRIADENANIV